MKLVQSLAATALLSASFAAAEDVLHSKRNLGKRFIDDQGNYNICQ